MCSMFGAVAEDSACVFRELILSRFEISFCLLKGTDLWGGDPLDLKPGNASSICFRSTSRKGHAEQFVTRSVSTIKVKQKKIWDEVGESDEDRDKMLLQLEHECLNLYKRKVDQAVKSKAHLLRALADAKLEFSTLLASLGESISYHCESR
ncbi:hypothetical protein L1987_42680 [Smallanthus sonchifolius]|uniref:Uncharacterized protein n=1 Tax=Smallanthus sonchifolius TaxID=185202 RepID=A0ACB9GKS1_9ASTR|nr:hypothetical protein L1987_42680 [Smallanthus sonchifolius]